MLGPLIAEQVDWAGDADRSNDAESINSITIT